MNKVRWPQFIFKSSSFAVKMYVISLIEIGKMSFKTRIWDILVPFEYT